VLSDALVVSFCLFGAVPASFAFSSHENEKEIVERTLQQVLSLFKHTSLISFIVGFVVVDILVSSTFRRFDGVLTRVILNCNAAFSFPFVLSAVAGALNISSESSEWKEQIPTPKRYASLKKLIGLQVSSERNASHAVDEKNQELSHDWVYVDSDPLSQHRAVLRRGAVFLKHGTLSRPKRRKIFLNLQLQRFEWWAPDMSRFVDFARVSDLVGVLGGKMSLLQKSSVLGRALKERISGKRSSRSSSPSPRHSSDEFLGFDSSSRSEGKSVMFTLIFNEHVPLELEADSPDLRDEWIAAIQALLASREAFLHGSISLS